MEHGEECAFTRMNGCQMRDYARIPHPFPTLLRWHAGKLNLVLLPVSRLEIDPTQQVVFRVVYQSVGGTRVILVLELNEHFGKPVFFIDPGLSDIDGSRVIVGSGELVAVEQLA